MEADYMNEGVEFHQGPDFLDIVKKEAQGTQVSHVRLTTEEVKRAIEALQSFQAIEGPSTAQVFRLTMNNRNTDMRKLIADVGDQDLYTMIRDEKCMLGVRSVLNIGARQYEVVCEMRAKRVR